MEKDMTFIRDLTTQATNAEVSPMPQPADVSVLFYTQTSGVAYRQELESTSNNLLALPVSWVGTAPDPIWTRLRIRI